MKFGFYVHIPYCIQRCHYCDFTTFEQSQIMAAEDYFKLLTQELETKKHLAPKKQLTSIYFGGGTPSLVSADLIVSFLQDLAKKDFVVDSQTEITIEINPATVDRDKLNKYLDFGISRFSIGAQSFSDHHLKTCGREHSSRDTLETINLFSKYGLNYSLDLLFALPQQTLAELQEDLNIIKSYKPPHVSPYCLTLRDNHPMNWGRPEAGIQTDMFDLIESELNSVGLDRYEISNFAQKGFESQHNLLYWQDHSYLGLGLSAHSYLPQLGPWGTRFWNSKVFSEYAQLYGNKALKEWKKENFFSAADPKEYEMLNISESLTDYCHTFLRTQKGLNKDALFQKYGPEVLNQVEREAFSLLQSDLLEANNNHWSLTPQGVLLSNKVFETLTFSRLTD